MKRTRHSPKPKSPRCPDIHIPMRTTGELLPSSSFAVGEKIPHILTSSILGEWPPASNSKVVPLAQVDALKGGNDTALVEAPVNAAMEMKRRASGADCISASDKRRLEQVVQKHEALMKLYNAGNFEEVLNDMSS